MLKRFRYRIALITHITIDIEAPDSETGRKLVRQEVLHNKRSYSKDFVQHSIISGVACLERVFNNPAAGLS
jgi:hypothetical protein